MKYQKNKVIISLIYLIKNVFRHIKNLILDSRCIFCGKRDLEGSLDFVCLSCYNSFLKNDFNSLCPVCKHPLDDSRVCNSCKIFKNIYYDSYDFVQFYTGYFKNILRMLQDLNFTT